MQRTNSLAYLPVLLPRGKGPFVLLVGLLLVRDKVCTNKTGVFNTTIPKQDIKTIVGAHR